MTGRPATSPARDRLTDDERALLDFEAHAPASPGAKEAAVRRELGLGVTRYQQMLNALLDRPAALAHDPLLVGRLLRTRDARRAARAARTVGPAPR